MDGKEDLGDKNTIGGHNFVKRRVTHSLSQEVGVGFVRNVEI